MQEPLYFYSRAGSEVNGPVTLSALKKLVRERVLDSTWLLCREGEDQWEPLNPEMFQSRPVLPVPPRPVLPKRKRSAWYTATRLMDPHIRRNLSIVAWGSIVLGAAVALHLRYVDFAATFMEPDSALEVVTYFIGIAGTIGFLGYLVSLLFEEPRRRLGRAIGMLSFAVIVVVLSYAFFDLQGDTNPPATSSKDNAQVAPSL